MVNLKLIHISRNWTFYTLWWTNDIHTLSAFHATCAGLPKAGWPATMALFLKSHCMAYHYIYTCICTVCTKTLLYIFLASWTQLNFCWYEKPCFILFSSSKCLPGRNTLGAILSKKSTFTNIFHKFLKLNYGTFLSSSYSYIHADFYTENGDIQSILPEMPTSIYIYVHVHCVREYCWVWGSLHGQQESFNIIIST